MACSKLGPCLPMLTSADLLDTARPAVHDWSGLHHNRAAASSLLGAYLGNPLLAVAEGHLQATGAPSVASSATARCHRDLLGSLAGGWCAVPGLLWGVSCTGASVRQCILPQCEQRDPMGGLGLPFAVNLLCTSSRCLAHPWQWQLDVPVLQQRCRLLTALRCLLTLGLLRCRQHDAMRVLSCPFYAHQDPNLVQKMQHLFRYSLRLLQREGFLNQSANPQGLSGETTWVANASPRPSGEAWVAKGLSGETWVVSAPACNASCPVR